MKIVFIYSGIWAIYALAMSSCGKKIEETKPIRRDITETVFASGILEARNTYTLTAESDGYLKDLNIEEGDIVYAGQVIGSIDNKENFFNNESAGALFSIAEGNTRSNAPSLSQAENIIKIEKQKLDQNFVQYQRYEKLLETNSVAKVDVENMKLQFDNSLLDYENALKNYEQLVATAKQQFITSNAEKNIRRAFLMNNRIKAIKTGKVYNKYKQPGDYIKRGEKIALIGSATEIYAKINVDEGTIEQIKEGQNAIIQLNTNSMKNYKGIVESIFPSFDEASQSFICRIQFLDKIEFSIINTQLQANILVGTTKQALLIPRRYLDLGGFVQVKGSRKKTKVTTGFISNDWVHVIKGIDENTILITDNIQINKVSTSETGAQMKF